MVENWIENALDMPKLQLVELTPRISFLSTTLPGDVHQDPADQIIVATARQEKAVFLTQDGLMHQYQHVNTLW
jgi:PIN domain nuclease of toxin-antitoxin system